MLGQKKNTETQLVQDNLFHNRWATVGGGRDTCSCLDCWSDQGFFIMNPSQNHEKKLPEAVKWQGQQDQTIDQKPGI